MRDLNEYKKEIFERSKEKLKTRRQRVKKITALCVPTFVCVIFLSVFVMPSMVSADKSELEMSDSLNHVANSNEKTEYNFSTVTVYGKDGEIIQAKQQECIEELFGKLNSLFETRFGNADISINAGDEEDGNVTGEDCITENTEAEENYRILFENDSILIEFEINGNEVKNKTTEQTAELTEEAFAEIKKILGI